MEKNTQTLEQVKQLKIQNIQLYKDIIKLDKKTIRDQRKIINTYINKE